MKIQLVEITEKVINWMDIKYSPTEIVYAIDRTNYTVKIDFEDKDSMETVQKAVQIRAAKMKLKLKTRSKGLSLYFYKKGTEE